MCLYGMDMHFEEGTKYRMGWKMVFGLGIYMTFDESDSVGGCHESINHGWNEGMGYKNERQEKGYTIHTTLTTLLLDFTTKTHNILDLRTKCGLSMTS